MERDMNTQIQPTPIVTGEKAKEIERLVNTEIDKDKIEQGKKVLEKMFAKTSSINKVKDAITKEFEKSIDAWRGLVTTDNMFLIGRIDAYETAIAIVEHKFKTVGEGEWILETNEEEPNPMFKLVVCSKCGSKANHTYPYCPHCGSHNGGNSNE